MGGGPRKSAFILTNVNEIVNEIGMKRRVGANERSDWSW